jgi:hypothetical protein
MIFGDRGDDQVFGAGGAWQRRISGGPGDDRLHSAADQVGFKGGPGNDVVISRSARVFYGWQGGNDVIKSLVPATATFGLADSPVGVRLDLKAGTLTGPGHTTMEFAPGTVFHVSGTFHRDVILGSDGPDVIRCNWAHEVVDGRGGDDLIHAWQGGLTGSHNRFRGGAGDDTISWSYYGNVVHAGPGDDTVHFGFAGGGGNAIYGGAGRDNMEFEATDKVYGGPGDDELYGMFEPGSDSVVAGGPGTNAMDVIWVPTETGTNAPWDHILIDLARGRLNADGVVSRFSGLFRRLTFHDTQAASWTIKGTDGPDTFGLFHYRKDAAVMPIDERGRAGDDILVTGDGDDRLDGGPGNDQGFAGDGGNDTCVSIEGPIAGRPGTGCETAAP